MYRTPPTSQRGASLALATLALTLCLPGLAQEGPALPLWELGAVGVAVSQQAYPGSLERVQQALGLQPGDVITHIDGEAIVDGRSGMMRVSRLMPGEHSQLTLLRDGKEQTVQVTIGTRPTPPG